MFVLFQDIGFGDCLNIILSLSGIEHLLNTRYLLTKVFA